MSAVPRSSETDYSHELRRALLLTLGILDTGPEDAFDGLTLGAMAATGCPVAALSLADGDTLWFKSHQGAHAQALLEDCARLDESLQTEGWLEVTDLTPESQWGALAMTDGDSSLRYYAGVAIRIEGLMVGSLCVADSQWREPMSATARETLIGLAAAAQALLQARRPGADADARALRRRQQLLARVSHEMRTPLNAIMGFAQLLRMSPGLPTDTPLPGWLQQIERGSQQMQGLVDELLELASFEVGRHRLARKPLDLLQLMLDTADLLTPQAAASEVTVQVTPPPEGANTQALADDRAVRQILANLVHNAIQHSPRGAQVTLDIRWLDETHLAVAVRDAGPGIAAADVPGLFEAIERSDAPAAQRPGTGLGLAISRQLAEAMHGAISVESELGVGSVFLLHLPAAGAA